MRKYKRLRFGHCYINRDGDFSIGLIGGNKIRGYNFLASHAHPNAMLGRICIRSRVVPNDGYWTEISPEICGMTSAIHAAGYKVNALPGEKKCVPVISKY